MGFERILVGKELCCQLARRCLPAGGQNTTTLTDSFHFLGACECRNRSLCIEFRPQNFVILSRGQHVVGSARISRPCPCCIRLPRRRIPMCNLLPWRTSGPPTKQLCWCRTATRTAGFAGYHFASFPLSNVYASDVNRKPWHVSCVRTENLLNAPFGCDDVGVRHKRCSVCLRDYCTLRVVVALRDPNLGER
jgi:hypothetical protein